MLYGTDLRQQGPERKTPEPTLEPGEVEYILEEEFDDFDPWETYYLDNDGYNPLEGLNG